jgi:hypothetical protein
VPTYLEEEDDHDRDWGRGCSASNRVTISGAPSQLRASVRAATINE